LRRDGIHGEGPEARGPKKTGSSRADVPRHALRIPQARAAVELEAAVDNAAKRGAMLIIALLRSGLTGPRKWIAAESVIDALDHHGCPLS
jgi:hypothetical protein